MTEKVIYIRFCAILTLLIMSGQTLCQDTKLQQFHQDSEVALLTNQTCYFAGSTLWFSLVHTLNFQEGASIFRFAEWVLADETDKPVASGRMKVDGNFSHGSFTLPGALASGYYRLIVMIATPEKGKLHYCQKWILVKNLYQTGTVEPNGFMGSNGAVAQLLPGHCRDSGQQGNAASFVVYPEHAPLRSRVDLGISLKDSAGTVMRGEFIVCVSKNSEPASAADSIIPGNASHSLPGACGMIETGCMSEDTVIKISLIRNVQENSFMIAGWLFPEDSLFTGDVIIGIPGENGYFVRQPLQDKRFLIVHLPGDMQEETLMIKLVRNGKEVRFGYNAFTCIKYLDHIPVLSNPFTSGSGSFLKSQTDNSLGKIIHAYEIWGINLLDHSMQTATPAKTRPGPFYGIPDVRIRPDEYSATEDMESFITDFVPQLRFRDKKQMTRLSFTPMYKTELRKIPNPQILINAVPVADAGIVKKIPVNEIDRIDIMLNPAVYLGTYFTGLIAIVLEDDGALKEYLPAEIKLVQIKKEQHPVALKAQMEATLPDLRTTLCWETGLKPDIAGRIKTMVYTSDISGSFVVSILGVTETGGLVQYERTITTR